MKTKKIALLLTLFFGVFFSGAQAQITWGSSHNMSGTSDVSTTGTLVDAATFNSSAQTVNGVTFNPLALSGSVYTDATGDITATSPGGNPGAYGTAYTTTSPSSVAYSAAISTLGFGYFNDGTVNLSGLASGHSYQVQVWSYYTASAGNCNTTLTGANTVTLLPVAGQYVIGTFTAGSGTLSFNYNYGADYGVINAIVVRDTTSGAAPAPPAGLTATDTGSPQISLAWTASTGATSYNVYRSTTSGSETLLTSSVSATSYTDSSGLTNGTTYYYKVAAVNSSGTSSQSTEASAYPGPPSTPTGFSASNGGSGIVNLTWSASAGATSYNIYSSTTSGSETLLTNVTTTTYSNTGLTNGTAYYYKVAAVNGGGTSASSIEASATPNSASSSQITWGSTHAVSGTSDVSTTGTLVDAATFNSSAQTVNGVTFNPLALSGSVYTDATGDITATSPGGNPGAYGTAYTTTSPSSVAYSAAISTLGFGYFNDGTVNLSGLASGHSYQVQVWSYYTASAGNCNTTLTGANTVTLLPVAGQYVIGTFTAGSGTLSFNYNYGADYGVINAIVVRDTTSGAAPAPPAGLTATDTGSPQISLAWTASTGATSYNVYRSTTSGSETLLTSSVSATSYTDSSGLTNGTTYYYKVAAVNSSGTSSQSTEASAYPGPPSTPTGFSASNGGSGIVNLTWSASAGATSYNIYSSTTSGSETLLTNVTTTTYSNTGLTNGTAYYYKVAAVNGGGTSASSIEASATPNSASSSQITWGSTHAVSGTSDVSTTGTLVDAATFNSSAQTVNGVTFNPLALSGSVYTDATGDITATSPGGNPGAYGTAYTTTSPSSVAYSAAISTLGFGYFNDGTVNLSGLASGHSYQVQVWSYYTASAGNCNTTLTGANTVTLLPVAGQYVIGTFTAGSGTLSFNYNYGADYGVINAIVVRDTTSGGTTYPLTTVDGTGGNGSIALSPSGGSYTAGTQVTLTADPKSGYLFSSWTVTSGSGTLSSTTTSPTTLTMAAGATTVTANYSTVPTYALTVTAGANGTASSTPASGGSYAAGTAVSITATPNSGYQFVNWTGTGSSLLANASSASTTLTNGMPTSAVSLTANFAASGSGNYSLSVTDATGGAGMIALSPTGGSYASGTQVTLTADPESGYQFVSWTGAPNGSLSTTTASPTTLTMPAANTSITATYVQVYSLSVNGGSSSGSYPAGTQFTVTANAPETYCVFLGWTDPLHVLANDSAASTTLTMPAGAVTLTANFSHILTITNGSGTAAGVTISPTVGVNPNTVVTITSGTAPTGYVFNGWQEAYNITGLATPSASTTTFTMPATDATITASYIVNTGTTYALTVTNGTGGGSYLAGATVTIKANAATSGNQFVRWLGQGSITPLLLGGADSSSTTITMPAAPTTVTASYGAIATPYAVTVLPSGSTGGGNYPAGTILPVTAAAAPSGQQFNGWTVTSGTATLANASFSGTTLTLPASNVSSVASAAVTITANYISSASTYALTVTTSGTGGSSSGSSGSGTYAPGTAVTITSAPPTTGYQFAGWTTTPTSISTSLSNAKAPTTTFNMPLTGAGGTVAATYTAISNTPTLVLAVGLEQIVPGYTGKAIRVQRPLDNAQMDINILSNGKLDISTLTTFLTQTEGQAQGWITTLYAQDGSGNNVTTPLPTSTATMPTISLTDPTSITVNGTVNPSTRNTEIPFGEGERYFVLPPSVSVNRSQASAFIACSPDFTGGGEGDPFMTLFEVGYVPPGTNVANPVGNPLDLISCSSGLEGVSQITTMYYPGSTQTYNAGTLNFQTTSVVERSQPTVVGLVTSPSSVPALYLDGTQHTYSGGSAPASTSCYGGFLLGGNDSSAFYGIPLYSSYNFLGFELYSGTVTSSTSVTPTTITAAILPRTTQSFNIVADGDSITQGTGALDGYNTLHYLAPQLNHPADITNLAVEGTTAQGAVNAMTAPTVATSPGGELYNTAYTKNIFYVAYGTNDIHATGTSGSATWTIVMTALQDAKALGYKTIVATILHENGETAAQSNEVNNFNALARAAVGQSYLDGLVDYEADQRLGNPGIYFPTFSADGTHPNDSGYQIMSTIAAPVFNTIIGP